jgi:hypothetical protein
MKFIHLVMIQNVEFLQMEVSTTMNISNTESPVIILAKTCGCKEKNMKVTYSFIDSYHSLCLDKKDIISAEIEACNRLLKYTRDERGNEVIEKEIAELKMSLDLIN